MSIFGSRASAEMIAKVLVAQSCSTFEIPQAIDRVLCPGDFPGKNTGVGCHFLLQRIFLTQELNLDLLCLLHWQVDSLPLSHLGSPIIKIKGSHQDGPDLVGMMLL